MAMVENSCYQTEEGWRGFCDEISKRDVNSSNFTLPLLGFNEHNEY
jgi:hypothetical protein